MDEAELNQHLSRLSTIWVDVLEAHFGEGSGVSAAQQRLFQRYTSAIYRYLRAAVRDPEVADELFQEFALRLVRGAFKRVDPLRGRFRDLLKTSLYHLIVDYQRQRQRRPRGLRGDSPEPAAAAPSMADSDCEFLTIWRAELMARAWDALAQHDRATDQHLYTVLRFRTDHPEVRSPQMVEQLAAQLGKPLSAVWIRKRLYHARQKFADLLVDEVSQSLENPTGEELEQELIDLGLLDYCRPALERHRQEHE